jgi:hypothetical protein
MSTDPGHAVVNHPVGEIPLLTVPTIPQEPIVQHDFVADPAVPTLPTLEKTGHGMESSTIQDFSFNSSQSPQNLSSTRQHMKFKDYGV